MGVEVAPVAGVGYSDVKERRVRRSTGRQALSFLPVGLRGSRSRGATVFWGLGVLWGKGVKKSRDLLQPRNGGVCAGVIQMRNARWEPVGEAVGRYWAAPQIDRKLRARRINSTLGR